MGSSFSPAALPDLSGKVFLVTGGNSGLGKESIQTFVSKGATVYMASRSESKAKQAIADIKAKVPGAKLEYINLDLSSFESIKKASEDFLSKESKLHVLLNNAGVMWLPYSVSKEGYEIQWATNYMGHFLLTKLLLPTIEKTAAESAPGEVRIVNVASWGHNVALRGLDFEGGNIQSWFSMERYGQSKLANILHAMSLTTHHPTVTSVSVHPGFIASNLYQSAASLNPLFRFGCMVISRVFTTAQVGAYNQIWAAASPDLSKRQSGEYFVPVGVPGRGPIWGKTQAARDVGLAEKLWEWSEAEMAKYGY